MTKAPLRAIRQAMDEGYEAVDVRSDRRGVEVELRRDGESHIVRLSRQDARHLLAGPQLQVHPGFQ